MKRKNGRCYSDGVGKKRRFEIKHNSWILEELQNEMTYAQSISQVNFKYA